jgi:hypothetical protein
VPSTNAFDQLTFSFAINCLFQKLSSFIPSIALSFSLVFSHIHHASTSFLPHLNPAANTTRTWHPYGKLTIAGREYAPSITTTYTPDGYNSSPTII